MIKTTKPKTLTHIEKRNQGIDVSIDMQENSLIAEKHAFEINYEKTIKRFEKFIEKSIDSLSECEETFKNKTNSLRKIKDILS